MKVKFTKLSIYSYYFARFYFFSFYILFEMCNVIFFVLCCLIHGELRLNSCFNVRVNRCAFFLRHGKGDCDERPRFLPKNKKKTFSSHFGTVFFIFIFGVSMQVRDQRTRTKKKSILE
jgi:hypothetical protein